LFPHDLAARTEFPLILICFMMSRSKQVFAGQPHLPYVNKPQSRASSDDRGTSGPAAALEGEPEGARHQASLMSLP